ncbi:MAG: hypothetical protein COB12_01320 [Flavobacterium sp.]|nr:MAG: hypothetical protein COB12_01320 [Flavobacterium sp.]
MTINEATNILNNLVSQTDKKSEIKAYNCFIRTLTSLNDKDLNESQLQLIQENLSSLHLTETPENKKKYYKKKHSELRSFLKKEFSFTHKKYYTEIGMIYGMIFGNAIGISIGVAIEPFIGISIGISIGTGIGMMFGIMYGAKKDAEALRLGNVI